MILNYRSLSNLAVNLPKNYKIGLFKGTFDLLHRRPHKNYK